VYNYGSLSLPLSILDKMAKELDIRWETLNYTARFARPAFALWGQGGKIMEGLYDALSNYGVNLANIQFTPTLPNATTPLLTIGVTNTGTLKFAYDRLEYSFSNFTTDFFQSLPGLFSRLSQWLRDAVPKFQFASHEFQYFTHCYLKTGQTEEFLASVNARTFRNAGLSIGHGSVFHHTLPEKKWETQLIIDRSTSLPNALFLSLNIAAHGDINYEDFLRDARAYFASMLQELDLALTELSES